MNRPRRGAFAEPGRDRGVIVLALIALQPLADLAGLVVPSATPLTHHRIGERLGVRTGSVLGGVHHEYLRACASA
jgi:hypothetical protein